MCGRYTITRPAEIIDEALALLAADGRQIAEAPAVRPRYNLAPTQEAPVLRSTGPRVAVCSQRWGLVSRHARRLEGPPRINARVETVLEKPSFRHSVRDRRCLVPGDGFFEWTAKRVGHQPHWLTLEEGRGFCFAGLWDRWRPPRGEDLDSFSFLTGAPNESVEWIHDRMPLVVPPDLYSSWLETSEEAVEPLLEQLRGQQPRWGAIPVSDAVNRVANDAPALLREVPPVPRNLSLF